MLKAEGFKNAKTRFEVLDTNKTTCALLQLEPITGLKHQIRAHLAEGLKCPILGDHKFSSDSHQPQVTYWNPRCNIRLKLMVKGVFKHITFLDFLCKYC